MASTHRKKGGTDGKSAPDPNLTFDPYSVAIKELSTSVHLLSCQEENVILSSLISLDRFAAKSPSNLEVLLQAGLNPKNLLSWAFEKGTNQLQYPLREMAGKLLARVVKIPKIRDSLYEGTGSCLACLERDESEVMNEYASYVLGELTIGTSVSYAAGLLINPPTDTENPLKVLFARMASSNDPDVIHNCLRCAWQILMAASVAPDSKQITDVIDDHSVFRILPLLFKSNYPSIQILSMAVSYEAAILSARAHQFLSSCFSTLLEILETPSDKLIHCTILGLLRRLLGPPPTTTSNEGNEPDEHAANFLSVDGPNRLLEFHRVHLLEAMQPGEVRFWSTISILALCSSKSTADFLINHHSYHDEIPNLLKDSDSNLAVAAANALSFIIHKANIIEGILNYTSLRDLSALAARWPLDEAVPIRFRQTFDGCSVAARVLARLVQSNMQARRNLVIGSPETLMTAREPTSDPQANNPKGSSVKILNSIDCIKDVIEKVGKLPDECISSTLATISAVASSVELRTVVAGHHGLVAAVSHCLEARPFRPPDPPAVELPTSWPETSNALELIVSARMLREKMWQPRNPAPEFSDPSMGVREAACVALGVLMLHPPAAETFVLQHGADKIRKLLEKRESGFGLNSLMQEILALITHCPIILAHALVANGTLGWMLEEAASTHRAAYSTEWNACISSILRSNPSAKFQVMGRLSPEDVTGDLFYVVCPSPGRYAKFSTLTEYVQMPPEPHRHIFVSYWPQPMIAPYISSASSSKILRGDRRSRSKKMTIDMSHMENPSMECDEDLEIFERSLRNTMQQQSIPGVRGMIKAIARLVWEYMAGPVKDGNFRKERHLEELKIELGYGDVIPIGKVRMGGHTERAILFKVLADRLGLPVALVRGPYGRLWVEVALVKELEKDAEVKEEPIQQPPVEEKSADVNQVKDKVKRHSGSSKKRDSAAEGSLEKKRSAMKIREERSKKVTGVSPSLDFPQEKLDIPLSVIKPNHLVDLMSEECKLYPIGSYEAHVYCGFSVCNSEDDIQPLPCLPNDELWGIKGIWGPHEDLIMNYC